MKKSNLNYVSIFYFYNNKKEALIITLDAKLKKKLMYSDKN